MTSFRSVFELIATYNGAKASNQAQSWEIEELVHKCKELFKRHRLSPANTYEFMFLSHCNSRSIYRMILSELIIAIENEPLYVPHLLEALAYVINNDKSPELKNSNVEEMWLTWADLNKILKVTVKCLDNVFIRDPNKAPINATFDALMLLLDAMVDAGFTGLDKDTQKNPLYQKLSELKAQIKENLFHPEIPYKIDYMMQALVRINSNETKSQLWLRKANAMACALNSIVLIAESSASVVGTCGLSLVAIPGATLEAYKNLKILLHRKGTPQDWYTNLRLFQGVLFQSAALLAAGGDAQQSVDTLKTRLSAWGQELASSKAMSFNMCFGIGCAVVTAYTSFEDNHNLTSIFQGFFLNLRYENTAVRRRFFAGTLTTLLNFSKRHNKNYTSLFRLLINSLIDDLKVSYATLENTEKSDCISLLTNIFNSINDTQLRTIISQGIKVIDSNIAPLSFNDSTKQDSEKASLLTNAQKAFNTAHEKRKMASSATPNRTIQLGRARSPEPSTQNDTSSVSQPQLKQSFDQSLEAKIQRLRQRITSDEDLLLEQATYIPATGTYEPGGKQCFDLEQAIRDLFVAEKKVLLLLGDSGAGKSLFGRYLEQVFWKEYLGSSCLMPLFISLPGSTDATNHVIESALGEYGFTTDEIKQLKETRKFLFILDAYDELGEWKNLYVSNKLSAWQAKVIISCRTQHLMNTQRYLPFFVPFKNDKQDVTQFKELIVAPFSDRQIHSYIVKYLSLPTNKATLDELQDEWKKPETYQRYIVEIPGLRSLIETPFLLKITMDVLPTIVEQFLESHDRERHKLTASALYDAFAQQWFERQQTKLIFDGDLPDDGRDLIADFEEFAQQLAMKMYERKISHVNYQPARKGLGLRSAQSRQDEWHDFFGSTDPDIVRARKACPLRKTGPNQYAFIHASLLEYFASKEIFEETFQLSHPTEKTWKPETTTIDGPPQSASEQVTRFNEGNLGCHSESNENVRTEKPKHH